MEQIDMFEMMYKSYKLDRNKEIVVLETFAGIGSQRKALERLSAKHNLKMKYLAPVEFDKYPVNSYNAIFNTEHTTKDITKTHSKDYHEQIDIFTYSFPCQDISLAGNRKGLSKEDNTRSGLLWEVERILNEFKSDDNLPKVLLMENVKNLLGEQFRADFQFWIRELEKLGYSNYFEVLNAKDYGIPQNRERVFMVSILGEYNYNFPQPIPLELRLKDMLEDEVDEKYYLSDKLLKCFTDMTDRNGFVRGERFNPINPDKQEYFYAITTNPGNRVTDNFVLIPEATKKGYAEATEGDGVDFSYPDSETRRGRVQKGMIQTLKTSGEDVVVVVNSKPKILQLPRGANKGGLHDNCTTITSSSWEQNNFIIGSQQANAAIKTDGVCPALTSAMGMGGGQIPLHNYDLRIRKLTPLECIRLMGFDDEDYYKMKSVNMSNSQIYKQCGNSIVVNVLEAIFEQLI